MSSIRKGVHNVLNWSQPVRLTDRVARRYATQVAATPAAPPPPPPAGPADMGAASDLMNQLETSSSLATVLPNDKITQRKVRKFNPRGRAMARRFELPGSRYQYHPPKYDRGPLHPIRSVPSSEPTSREFVPGPFSIPRIKHTYYDTIAHDLLVLGYTHNTPGEDPGFIPRKYEDRLKTWDDSSPYHKGRGPAGPRGGDRLPLLEKPISFTHIPEIESIAISCFVRDAQKNRDAWVAAWTALRAIGGRSPWNIRIKNPEVKWHTQANYLAGVKTTILGDAAYEFIDRLLNFVLPKIKDWPGLEASTGDKNGNIQLGLKPLWVSYFPEIMANYDMYPVKLIPGMHISIKTTAQSNRHARLLMQALGIPFIGKVKN